MGCDHGSENEDKEEMKKNCGRGRLGRFNGKDSALVLILPLSFQGKLQRSVPFISPGKKFFVEAAIKQHVGVNRVRLVQVQAHARQILKTEIGVAINLRATQPGLEVRGLPGISG